MINVSADSWHAGVYRGWYKRKYGATKTVVKYAPNAGVAYYSEVPNDPEQTNLCPYMRAVMFWSWMRIVFLTTVKDTWLIVWYLFAGAIAFLTLLVSHHPKAMLEFFGLVGAIFGLAFGIVTLTRATSRPSVQRAVEGAREFGGLLHEYGRSAHDRICPEVTISKGASNRG